VPTAYWLTVVADCNGRRYAEAMLVRRAPAHTITFALIAIAAVTVVAWAQKSTPSSPSPRQALTRQVPAQQETSGGTSTASLAGARPAESDDSNVKLVYMDDILPPIWSPRDHVPTPAWLNADASERRPMSWALWYSSVTRWLAGHRDIMLVVLAKENQTAATRELLVATGAKIQFELKEIGFFRALVPLSSISRIYQSPLAEEIESAHYGSGPDLFESFYFPITDVTKYEALSSRYLLKRLSPSGDPGLLQCCTTQAIFNPAYAAERASDRGNGFIERDRPAVDLGLEELKGTHPTFDGRGVTVGVYDMFPQLNHPALGEALSLEGRKIPKIPRVQLDPSTFTQSVRVFTFHKPSPDESSRFGPLLSSSGSRNMLVAEARIDREYADKIKAVFDPAFRRFGFDIDQDDKLGPTEWFRDYHTAPRESVLYTTQFPTGAKQSAVFFLFADYTNASAPKATFVLEWMHGTMSLNAVSAGGRTGLRPLGLAPASQIVPYSRPGSYDPQHDPTSSTLDQLLSAILAEDIDLVTAQFNFVLSEDNSYELTQKAIERALTVRPKAVFMSSGNGTSSIEGHFSNAGVFARGVIAIGASVGPTVGSALFGSGFGGKTVVDPGTSIGPASDGARATLLFTTSRYPYYSSCIPGDVNARPLQPAFADRMPNCTWLTWATSGAAPPAAAVAASLLSGLRQRGYAGDSTVVANALVASAEPLNDSSFDFAAGQMSAAKAWDWIEKNVLSKSAKKMAEQSKLLEPFEIRAPIRHEGSLRTGRYYSTRGLYDRFFDASDVGKCTSVWVRSSSRGEPREHNVTLLPSGGSVVLVTTRLTGSTEWQPITLCVAAPIESIWSGTVSIRRIAAETRTTSETPAEQRIPVTIVAPMKLRAGKNSPSVPAVHFGGMLLETHASVPVAISQNQQTLADVVVRPQSAKSQVPIFDWVTMNGSNGALQSPLSKVGVNGEAGLLVHARLLNIPVYPTTSFSLPAQRNAIMRSDANESWSVSVTSAQLRDYRQRRAPSMRPCPEGGQALTLFFEIGVDRDVPDVQSTCLPEIGAQLVSFNATSSIDSLIILKPQPAHQYEFAVFRYKDGIWLPQISSFHSIWKTRDELKSLPPGEWRIFMRRVEPVQPTEQRAGKAEPKWAQPK
jgi:hypothetical protein